MAIYTMAKLQTLRPRIATQPGRLAVMQPGSWRTDKQTAAQRGYGYKWQQARAAFLAQAENVLCRMCERDGRTVMASVVDHIVPHRGDQSLFWRRSNWQPLCASCHSSEKQRQDAAADAPA